MSVADLVEHVHHTAICAQDFDAMRDFFVDFLGFEVEGEKTERSEPELALVTGLPGARLRWALLRLGSHRIELFHFYSHDGRSSPAAQCDTGFTHLAFEVRDVDETHARAVSAGFAPLSPPQVMRGGVCRVFYLRGPEDIVVEFMEFAQKEPA